MKSVGLTETARWIANQIKTMGDSRIIIEIEDKQTVEKEIEVISCSDLD